MLMWHPASLLLSWISFALLLQSASPRLLLGLATVCLLLAVAFAPMRSLRLLRRSRWLLLSIGLLFMFLSPGEYLPGFAGQLGLTYEGVERTGEQLGRLLAILVSLALLHEYIGTQGLLAGLYRLLGPFAWREASVVRLMLVLELVEEKREIPWREWLTQQEWDTDVHDCFTLLMPRLRLRDRVLMSGLAMAGLSFVFW